MPPAPATIPDIGSDPPISIPCTLPIPTITPVPAVTDCHHALLDSLIGPSPSIYSALAAHLLTDPSIPPLLTFPSIPPAEIAALLQNSPALAPSKPLNAALTTLVKILTTPRPPATTASLLALARAPAAAARAASIRIVAAAAEREMEISYGAVMRAAALRGDTPDAVLGTFLYIDNYDHLCAAEARILQRAMGIAHHDALHDVRVAFAGSGPLPLSAILLHVRFGASVVLVDVDSEAVGESRRLIAALEGNAVLAEGALTVVESCAASACYVRPGAASCGGENVVVCDAVVLASLLPSWVKCAALQGIGKDDEGPAVVLARSAVDLVDCFAYERTPCRGLEMGRMQFQGEWIPTRECGDGKEENILGYIDGGVLNSVEVFSAAPSRAT